MREDGKEERAMSWVERAERQVEEDYESGAISSDEYNQQMRDIHDELEQEAQDNAEAAYRETFY